MPPFESSKEPPFKIDTEHSERNDYRVTFDQTQSVNFYGHEVTPFDQVLLRGYMPDNNVASLKILHSIGSQITFLERQKAEAPKNTRPHYETIVSELDLAVNAHTARLVQLLGKIEQVRGGALTEEDRNKLITEIEETFNESIEYIEGKKGTHLLSISRCDRVKNELMEQKESFKSLISTTNTIDTKAHQRIFRAVLQQYEALENVVSAFDGISRNRSSTEGYQDASAALQNHVYTVENPSDIQLWKVPQEGKVVLNTANYDQRFRRDDLLLSLHQEEPDPIAKQKVDIQTIRERQIPLSQEGFVATPVVKPAESQGTEAADSSRQGEAEFKSTFQAIVEEYKKRIGWLSGELTQADIAVIMEEFVQKVMATQGYEIPGARPVHFHQSNDMYSALGHASETIATYFSQEMAAKHPGITFGFFSITAMTFGSAALVNTGHMANAAAHCLHFIEAKISQLTGGHVSPADLNHMIITAEKKWASFTHSSNSLMKRIIMDAVGLPKLSYIIGEMLFSERTDRTTMAKIAEQLRHDETLALTDEEQMAKTLLTAGVASLGLAVLVGTGLLLHYITTLPVVTNHAVVNAPLKAAGFVVDVAPSEFTGLATVHGVLPEIIAMASTLLAVKAASIGAGKIYLFSKQMLKENEDPAVVQYVETLSCLYLLYKGELNTFRAAMESSDRKYLERLVRNSNALYQSRPELFTHMTDMSSMINQMEAALNHEIKTLPATSGAAGLTDTSDSNGSVNAATPPDVKAPNSSWASTVGILLILWNRAFGPPVATLYQLGNLIFSGVSSGGSKKLFWEIFNKNRIDREMSYQSAKIGRLVVSLATFAFSAGKTIVASAYGAAVLGTKALLSAGFFGLLAFNKIVRSSSLGSLFEGIGILFAKPLLKIANLILELVAGIVKAVDILIRGIVSVVLGVVPLAIGILASPFGVLAAFGQWFSGKDLKSSFSSVFVDGFFKKGAVPIALGIAKVAELASIIIPANIAHFLRVGMEILANSDMKMNRSLLEAPGGYGIQEEKDENIIRINQASSYLKNYAGGLLNILRTETTRSLDSAIQTQGVEKDKQPEFETFRSSEATILQGLAETDNQEGVIRKPDDDNDYDLCDGDAENDPDKQSGPPPAAAEVTTGSPSLDAERAGGNHGVVHP
jgi:hypothetical protein